jgi:predicted nuclease with TOPRIM domain
MSWLETLTKETFQTIVREAVKEELDLLRPDVNDLKRQNLIIVQTLETLKTEIDGVKQRITKLEEQVSRLEDQVIRVRESQMNFADRVGRLEGTLEGSLRGIAADLKLDLYEKFRGALPAKATSSKAVTRKKAKRAVT